MYKHINMHYQVIYVDCIWKIWKSTGTMRAAFFAPKQDIIKVTTRISREVSINFETSVNQWTSNWTIQVNRNRPISTGLDLRIITQLSWRFLLDKGKARRKRDKKCMRHHPQIKIFTWPSIWWLFFPLPSSLPRWRILREAAPTDTYLIGRSPPCGSAHGYWRNDGSFRWPDRKNQSDRSSGVDRRVAVVHRRYRNRRRRSHLVVELSSKM